MTKNILVIDDTYMTTYVLKTVLERAGFGVCTYGSMEELFKNWDWLNTKFDLLLLDVHLPGIDGISAIKRIRLIPELADVPIMMLTSDPTRQTVYRALISGAVDYIIKPFVTQDLIKRVNKLLNLP